MPECLKPFTALHCQHPSFSRTLKQPYSTGLIGSICKVHTDPSINVRTGLLRPSIPSIIKTQPVTQWSWNKCKKKTVKSVIHRFYRLHNGIWVRRIAGSNKKAYKKTGERRKRHRYNVLCNRYQSKVLDRMVTPYWYRRRYYIEDPWEKYHDRHFTLGPKWSGYDQTKVYQANRVPENMKKFVPPPRPEYEYRYAKPNKLTVPDGKPPKLNWKDIEQYKGQHKWTE
ncbi:large ribosomal subunit protein bL35m-like [Saccoglossus kowalevskii]|uniref:Large ribosomal subunit protein bL35m n=1 Tax=Saccoglossus kowalevskii TaxID=10224 RepID=A0ABM0GNM4_SACKO|nr:PREDICTED: 39S ribosomal protein L35, mitochondrial-like [Saccoglossus kowalevskii]